MLIVDEHHLRRVLTEYLRHYNAARPHRAPASSHRLKLTPGRRRSTSPSIDPRKQILGGLTHEYQIAA
jgi:putative transposase